jgi:predicted dinucleotide-binding enzyme
MSYKVFASLNIAIIGAGRVNDALARNLLAAGHSVYVGVKDDKAYLNDSLFEEFDDFYASDIETAASHADVIILATSVEEVKEAAYLLDDVKRKVIIDMSGLNAAKPAKQLHTIKAIKAITYSDQVVKCYSCSGYEKLINPFAESETMDMLIAGGTKKAKEVAKLVTRDIGFTDCFDFDDANAAALLDKIYTYMKPAEKAVA